MAVFDWNLYAFTKVNLITTFKFLKFINQEVYRLYPMSTLTCINNQTNNQQDIEQLADGLNETIITVYKKKCEVKRRQTAEELQRNCWTQYSLQESLEKENSKQHEFTKLCPGISITITHC